MKSDHILHDMRSLERHRIVAQKLSENPTLIHLATDAIARWRALVRPNRPEPYYLKAWEDIIEQGLDATIDFITSDTEYATELRQSSPFVGFMSNKERTEFLRTWKEKNSNI